MFILGIRLMIIELRKYNSAEELHIGLEPQGHRTFMLSERGRRASVTRAVSAWGGRNGDGTGTRRIQMGSSRNEHETRETTAE